MHEPQVQTDFGGNLLQFYDNGFSSRNLKDFLGRHTQIDPWSVLDFLLFESVIPPHAPVLGVRALVPGEIRRASDSRSLWSDIQIPVRPGTLRSYVDEFEQIIQAHIQGSGVEKTAGVLLSGGIDSAIILSYLGPDTPCLTWEAWENSTDLRYSRETARQFGIHQHIVVTSDYERDFEAYKHAVQTLKVPLLFSGAVPWARMAEAATQNKISACFAGQNADTLFMSYPAPKHVYFLSRLNSFLPFNPLFFWNDRRGRLLDTSSMIRLFAYFKSNGLFPAKWIKIPDGYFEEKEKIAKNVLHPKTRAQEVIMTEEFFTEARKSQINQHEVPSVWGVDIDCPYYDRAFIETALALPQALRRLEKYDKVVFKELARKRRVPESVITHKKKGLSYGAKFYLERKLHLPIWQAMEKDEFMNHYIDVKAARVKAQDNFYTFDQLQSLYWWGQFVAVPEKLTF